MPEFFEHPIQWAKAHPYIAVGGAVVGVALVWFLWPSSSSSSSSMTPQQQLAMQKLTGNQQLQALRIQNQPALASIHGQNYATSWQGRLGQQSISEQTTLANIQANELASQQAAMAQQTGFMGYLQYLIARMSMGYSAGPNAGAAVNWPGQPWWWNQGQGGFG